MLLNNRHGSVDSDSYRYGFGGQEKDNEISGEANSYTAEFWQYDPRIGRRWNIDPMTQKYSWQSPYAVFNNNPLYFNDPKGLEGDNGNKKLKKHEVSQGETLTGIAETYGTSVVSLAKWNNIKDINKIFIGDSLIVTDPTRPKAYTSFENFLDIKNSSGWIFGSDEISEMSVSNGAELAAASISNQNVANITGYLLDKVKTSPTMISYESEILNQVKSDPRYEKENYYITGKRVIEFGGKRGSGDDWFSGNQNDPVFKKETWDTAFNQLTWALRHATVKYWAEVGKDGLITIQYKLYDTLDLSGSKGRSGTYNNVSNVLGFFYHDVANGNINLQTRGEWEVSK
ncbi:LysM peptidoglycan-binding domain-containing protein [Nonlabens xylanidelens]|nr:LysM peptidoglycan-binding domain-containing protein [Nonlabens xylanidelens]PQJ18920.1 hypothetical protein BST94_06795 [Nonlabens xylanidelens]PQJ19516.1 hypothetical protein BST94_06740 [Nonlabens xylanidelens]PQJ23583.1 hypothetical protein BST94_00030 [Nonlabens xylanidelens]